MTHIYSALLDAGRLRATFAGTGGYGLAYGSHARGSAASDSDLDLLLVGDMDIPPDRLAHVINEVKALHRHHGLRLDTEVAYEMKLYATTVEVEAATSLRGFTITPAGGVNVPRLVLEPWFLNSHLFKLRLVLNALTTPHVFLGGCVERYEQHRATAERSTALLALSLLEPISVLTVLNAAETLVTSTDGASGKDFLGYTHGPHLVSMLQRGLGYLTREQAVRAAGGGRFGPNLRMCRKLLAALAPP